MKNYLLILVSFISCQIMAGNNLYKVIFKKGDVQMTRAGETRKIFKGDFLIAKDLVETKGKSMVILGFGESYMSRMKISESTKLNIDGLAQDPDDKYEEKSYFSLKAGNILVNYINKKKDKNRLKVKTKTASMGIRGTEFFIHTTQDGQTLVAVKSGVVLAKHKDKNIGIPLTFKEGVVFTESGSSGKLNPPTWYKEINWDVSSAGKKLEDLMHKDGINRVTIERVVSRIISVKGGNVDNLSLDDKSSQALQKECKEGVAKACTDLALFLLRNGKIEETKPLVLSLFQKACDLKDARGCVWVGRTEFEFGDKKLGKGHILKLCEGKNAYACYSMWELEKAWGSEDEAQKYYKLSLSIMHNIEDFDKVFAEFEEACLTENKEACLNLAILSENLNKKMKAKELYLKGCDMGSGAACSNLGYMYQGDKNMGDANKYYTKACFLDEAIGCYNLACLHAKNNKNELSKQYLRMAIIGGYNDWAHINRDTDLAGLRKDSSYKKFVEEVKSEVTGKKKDTKKISK
jgi:TPR repeat protein